MLTVIDSPSRNFWKFLLQKLLRFKKMMLKEKVFLIYVIVGSLILITIVTMSYFIHGILNTGIMLGGWDTPFYAWYARTVIQYGPSYLMQLQSYPNLYAQLLAFFGFISGSVVLAQRIFPIALGMLSILLFALISYRISNNVHVTGLTAILTSLTVGTLHLVSEYHRNHMAYVLGLSAVLIVPKLGDTIINRRFLLITLLLLGTAATQFETFVLFSLVLIIAVTMIKDWRKLVTLLFSMILAAGILFISFPEFLNRYYLNIVTTAISSENQLSYGYLVFWTIGSWILLPVALFGLLRLYLATKCKETRAVSLPIFMLSILIILPTLVFIHTGNSELNSLAGRAILLLPIPVILALGIEQITNVVRIFSIRIELCAHTLKQRTLVIKGKGRAHSIVAILLSVMMIVSLTYTSVEATKIIMVPLLRVSGYSKIVAVRQYLQNNNLEAPIFMFNGSSLWNSDLYRTYIGTEIGEHLAYFGDLENLIELRPTGFSYSGLAGEIANFTSVRYLEDMLGDKKYLIYPQKAFVENISDLRLRPLVYIVPELWDAPVPFCVKRFQVADDIYVVPSLAEIENKVRMEVPMTLETEKGISEVKGKIVSGTMVRVEIEVGSTWFRLNDYPTSLVFMKLEQDGALSYPESDPARFEGNKAITGNDPAENLQYWRLYEGNPGATMVVDGAVRKEGVGSLQVTGTTDAYGNVMVTFDPPNVTDLSDYSTLSFWSMVDQKNIQWAVALRDSSGHRAAYWNLIGGNIEQDNEVSQWKRLVMNLSQPNEISPEFDFKKIDYIDIIVYAGKSGINLTYYIDDLTLDKPLKSGEIYKTRVLPNEKLVVYFSIEGEMNL